MLFRKLLFLLLCTLGGCVNSPVKAPVDKSFAAPPRRIEQHIVSAGETLFSIAWSYGIDFRRLADTNGLQSPYRLQIGQLLRLPAIADGSDGSGKVQSRAVAATPAKPMDERSKGAHSASESSTKSGGVGSCSSATANLLEGWRWPADGAVIARYAAHSAQHKGIDIRGELGEPVYAVSGGKVVYAGSGLVGYGNLLIVKHSDRYLSAYAHNSRLLVGEGKIVKAGDRIAEIGDSGTDSVKLHFEIRCDGEPIDPLRILPQRP